ncbi:MAG: hypothetical protein KKG60_00900 [Nanoarchaeota archaeon]|nr:hypothetical protein [Nanoarchaeota archaeon]
MTLKEERLEKKAEKVVGKLIGRLRDTEVEDWTHKQDQIFGECDPNYHRYLEHKIHYLEHKIKISEIWEDGFSSDMGDTPSYVRHCIEVDKFYSGPHEKLRGLVLYLLSKYNKRRDIKRKEEKRRDDKKREEAVRKLERELKNPLIAQPPTRQDQQPK